MITIYHHINFLDRYAFSIPIIIQSIKKRFFSCSLNIANSKKTSYFLLFYIFHSKLVKSRYSHTDNPFILEAVQRKDYMTVCTLSTKCIS